MWKKSNIKVQDSIIRYWIKCYERDSKFGINEWRTSKFMRKSDGEIAVNYDRDGI
ncbi:DUF7678 domain-containing protein [Lactobacillus delbrueckii]|uniref:DUF7678 domain-containing protein n=1 Tax=Lactobacillus delbrueckii TaxID=1584 RepID=UPI004032DD73